MRIIRIELDEVMVPARPDSINSEEFDRPLHKLASGGLKGWSVQFDCLSKTIIRVHLENGIAGLGESYRDAPQPVLQSMAARLLDTDLRALNLQDLPLPRNRWYDGFECALIDAYCKSIEAPFICCWWRHGSRSVAASDGQCSCRCRVLADSTRGYDALSSCAPDPVVEWCGIRDACGLMSVILDPNERFDVG